MSEENFDDIWLFVEDKLRTSVPKYIKNVLKVCGYNNGIALASIEEGDFDYLEGEVRNGNLMKYFAGFEERIVLYDCTKSIQNFEFTRGHKKFLLFIASFLKAHSEENGLNSFTSETAQPKVRDVKNLKYKRRAKSRIVNVPYKKMKISSCNSDENHTIPARDDLSLQRINLLKKALMSLIKHTPDMYVGACVKVPGTLIYLIYFAAIFSFLFLMVP